MPSPQQGRFFFSHVFDIVRCFGEYFFGTGHVGHGTPEEIAIIKSVGGSPATVSFAFLLAGYFTGFCGILAGLPVGVLCALHVNELLAWLERGINTANRFFHSLAGDSDTMPVQLLDPAFYLENIPVTVRFRELFLVAAGTLVLSVLVSLLPAIRAGREKPLDTLRKF